MISTQTISQPKESGSKFAHYDTIADSYDNMISHGMNGQFYKIVTEFTVKSLLSKVESQVMANEAPRLLDVGCGSGYFTRFITELCCGKFKTVVGFDISKGMVDLAIQKEKENPMGIQYRVADLSAKMPPLQEGPFDLVTSIFVLHYSVSVNELEQMFRSVAENMKAGAPFFGILLNPDLCLENFPSVSLHLIASHFL